MSFHARNNRLSFHGRISTESSLGSSNMGLSDSRGGTIPFTSPIYESIYKNIFPTKPPTDIALKQDALVKALDDAGIWAKLDAFYMTANKTEAQSVLNWVKNDSNLIKRLSTTFNSLFGFKGNSADGSYMEWDFNPSTDAVNYTNEVGSIFCYMNTNIPEDHAFLFGTSQGGTLAYPSIGMINRFGSWQSEINTGSSSLENVGEFFMPGRNAGFISWVRNVDGKIKGYFNGYYQSQTGVTVLGTSLLNDAMYVFKNKATGQNKSDNGMGCFGLGGALSDSENTTLYTEIQKYMVYVNANESFGTSKLVSLDFEEDTYLRKGYWVVTGGTPDFQYTTDVLSGTKSARIPSAAGAKIYFPKYTGKIQIKFKIKFDDATPGSNSDYLLLKNGTTTIGYIRLYTTGRNYLSMGGANYGATVMSDATIYYMWLEYEKGTGANSTAKLFLSTTNIKPETPECIITGGSSTLTPDNLEFYGGTAYTFDDLEITTIV